VYGGCKLRGNEADCGTHGSECFPPLIPIRTWREVTDIAQAATTYTQLGVMYDQQW